MDSGLQGRSSKRARTSASRSGDNFVPGNIVEIEVHNFMTYTHLKSKPGPRLNLVIGPNGTGKSSLVCAICIGLAGEPALLGRASSIGDYVKRGEESGWVKVSLCGHSPGQTIKITRKINKQSKSEWIIEDRGVSRTALKREVLDLVQQFNIQVNNLTQFLPQDRVCEFAKLTPIQLLEETEKAVGDPELSGQHATLIKKSEELKHIETTLKQHATTLEHLKANNADLEKDVQRVQERKKLLEKAENLRKKLPWLRYDQKKNQYNTVKEMEKDAKKRVDEVTKVIVALNTPLGMLRKKRSELETASKKFLDANVPLDKRRRELVEEEQKMGEQVRSKAREIAEVHRREATQQEKITTATRELAEAEAELADLGVYEPPKEEIQELGARIRELELGVADRRNQRQEREAVLSQKRARRDQCVGRLQEIDNVKTRLLQALKDTGAQGVFDAYHWVESHRNDFQKDVYGPVLLEVNIANQEYAKYVENHVPGYLWKAFVTQDTHDRDLLQQNLQGMGVPIINARDTNNQRAPSVTSQMQEVGIVARLDEVLSAPEVVKHVLIGQAALDHSFIGTSQANHRADEACALGIRDLWTPENHYRWTASRYGGHISASVNSIRDSRLFSKNVDARQKNELEQQKAEVDQVIAQTEHEIKALNNELRALEDNASKLHKQREEFINRVKLEKKKRTDLSFRVEQRKRKLESFKHEEDCKSAEDRLYTDIKKLNERRKNNILQMKDVLMLAGKNQISYASRHLSYLELDVKVREMERDLKTQELRGIDCQRVYDNCKRETERCRGELASAKEAAEQVAVITAELQEMFRGMPETVVEVEDAINEAVAEANAVLCNNPNVLEEYERRCKQISALEEKMKEENEELQIHLLEIESLKAKWLPTLKLLVSKINDTFSNNFKEMAVAGEVLLDEHGTNFDKYGILIKVKFRETGELQVLSAHHQSGGERSVATILYLVSLQDLTHCPFRVVDEINQGMDPQNERKMFQQLVRAASQLNTPQCFLLTPKLLPNLEYTEACTILNVMNGPYIGEAASVWKDGVSWAVLSQTAAH